MGNPILDIIYFLFSSVQPKTLVDKFDELFKHYYDQLNDACQVLGVGAQAPTFEVFTEQLNTTAHYAFMILSEIVPAVVMERHADANIAAFLGDPESEPARNLADKMFNNPKFVEILEHVIPFLNKRGFMAPYQKPQEVVANEAVPQTIPVAEASVVETPVLAEAEQEEEVHAQPIRAYVNNEDAPVIAAPAVVIKEEKKVEVALATPVEEIVPTVDVVVVENQKEEAIVVVAAVEEPKEQPTSPTITIEPWPSTAQDNKPKRLMKARIEETINKFAAMETNGTSKLQ